MKIVYSVVAHYYVKTTLSNYLSFFFSLVAHKNGPHKIFAVAAVCGWLQRLGLFISLLLSWLLLWWSSSSRLWLWSRG